MTRSFTAAFLFATCVFVARAHTADVTTSPDASATQAVEGLLQRLLPQRAESFVFQPIPRANGRDVFELEGLAQGRILIRGNNGVSMASGLNWYLKHFANCQVTWRSRQLDLPEPLPVLPEKIRIVSPHRYRYYFNYCSFSYTMAYWDWSDWERMIDLMALYGVNAPLSVTGQEGVWRELGRRFGLSQEHLQDFFVGPGFLPFGWMGCIDRWAGPLPDSWIDQHVELEKKIVQRQRQLGMTPILQGFTGHAPRGLKDVFPAAEIVKLSPWIDFEPTYFIDPGDPLFIEVGRAFVEEQTRLYGTDHLYASDTFIEKPPTNNDPAFLRSMGGSIHRAMSKADPEAIWVLQGWLFVNAPQFWQPAQAEALLRSVPQDKLLVLDLHCESRPTWRITNAFHGQPWVWCIIQNFGGTVSLHGGLDNMARDLNAALAQRGQASAKLSGIGFIMEGIGWNPIVDEFQSDMVWRERTPKLEAWIEGFARRRYGADLPAAQAAWKTLYRTAYQRPGRRDNLTVARPKIGHSGALEHDMLRAWKSLLDCAGRLADQDTYQFDLVNVTRQTLGSLSALYYRQMIDAFDAGDRAALNTAFDKLEGLLLDLDAQLGSHDQYLLGTWLERAKRWATTEEERRLYEWNARTIITLWGKPSTPLDDYSNRQWSGMMGNYYALRWRLFHTELDRTLAAGRDWDATAFDRKIRAWQAAWARQTERFPVETNGRCPVKTSKSLYQKYRAEFAGDLAQSLKPGLPYSAFNPDDYPAVKSLTTGKPVTCGAALPPFPPELANDGVVNSPNSFWACDVGVTGPESAWWCVDLEETTSVGRVVVVGYYMDRRSYGFLVEGSLDSENWVILSDQRKNRKRSTIDGYELKFTPREIRFLRVTQARNSANSGRHLIEVMAFEQ